MSKVRIGDVDYVRQGDVFRNVDTGVEHHVSDTEAREMGAKALDDVVEGKIRFSFREASEVRERALIAAHILTEQP